MAPVYPEAFLKRLLKRPLGLQGMPFGLLWCRVGPLGLQGGGLLGLNWAFGAFGAPVGAP